MSFTESLEDVVHNSIAAPSYTEWLRMTREIVGLKLVNAALQDKVAALETELEKLKDSGTVLDSAICSSLSDSKPPERTLAATTLDASGLMKEVEMTLGLQKEGNMPNATSSQVSHKRKADSLEDLEALQDMKVPLGRMEDVAKPLQQKEDVDSARSHNSASSESLNPSDVDKAKRVNAGQRDTLDPANSGNPSEKRPRRSQRQNYPLPCYSIDLPPLDRSKCSKAFYEDLQDRFIIAGFDEERFSCWCHVEKGKQGETDALLSTSHVTHMNGRRHRYRSAAWFHHAERCAFYKDPWAVNLQGERRYPSFPLPKPTRTIAGWQATEEVVLVEVP